MAAIDHVGGCFARSLIFSLISCTAAFAGTITAVPTLTMNGALFHYNYTITNTTGNELTVLDIAVSKGASTIQNLAVPAGFSKAFDSVLGLVSFLENSSTFGSVPISGFVFDSPIAPGATSFNGTLLDSNFNVVTLGGPTTGPAVPEPGNFPILSAIFCIAVFACNRRRVMQLGSFIGKD